MEQTEIRTYGYRWVVLLVFMLIIAVNQFLWITFAPITSDAAAYYGVSDLSIGLLSMVFMIVYLFVSIPASWMIDTYGIKVAVGIGAVLTGGFGLMRGLVAQEYSWVLVAQIGIAIAQPFILNAITTVAARWFPLQERATAAGLGSLAMYLGILLGVALTPYFTVHYQLSGTLLIYGVVAAAATIVFFIFVRERPPTPASLPGQAERSLVLDGLKESFRIRDFNLLLAIFFVGLGVFNAVTTWIEEILSPRGFSSIQAGNTGGLMILGGIFGAVLIPLLSDRSGKRVPYLRLAIIGATVGLLGITFAGSYALLLLASFVFGFFLLSAGPVGFQYGAEVTHPMPEGTSNGLLLLMGQISGILFIFGMDGFKSPGTGSMTLPLVVLIGLLVLSFGCGTLLKEATRL